MKGNNKMTSEDFIASFKHPRKRELATMIFAEASMAELAEKGYLGIVVQEMVALIKREVVEGKEFEFDMGLGKSSEPKEEVTGPMTPSENLTPKTSASSTAPSENLSEGSSADSIVDDSDAPVEGPVSTDTPETINSEDVDDVEGNVKTVEEPVQEV